LLLKTVQVSPRGVEGGRDTEGIKMNSSVPVRILVLDDEAVQRMTVRLQLRGLGECIDFDDPREALAYLSGTKVHAAVVDVRMSGLDVDGLWFLRELRAVDQDLPVVLRTGEDGQEVIRAVRTFPRVELVIKGQADSTELLRAAILRATTSSTGQSEKKS